MICPACKALNDDSAEACFTCGRALTALTQGSLIDSRYEILSPLGKGGMGMVYKAYDRELEETVAIKVLRAEFANTGEMAKRFRHEVKQARKVSHRNVCRIHDYGEDGGVRFISMEYVEGTDIKQLARDKGGYLEADEAFDVAIQAADGLQAIHDVGIIHRDLKTSNIMRDNGGRVRLMDFGIAKIGGADPSTSGGLTSTGQIMGTPEYMSPEQCLGDKIDHRSDIYALGIAVYEIFSGTVPFRGDTPVATLFKHIQDPVPFEGPVAARIPLSAVPVLRKSLAKNRADRYANAAEVAAALRSAQQQAKAGVPADVAPTGGLPVIVPLDDAGAGATPTPSDRRRVTRLDIFVNLIIRRVGTAGTVLQEERTIAENVGRGGARVMTTITALAPGDIVHLEEVGGPFKTRAEVRGSYVGKDHVRRLNLRFLDSPAPDYLVHVDEGASGGRRRS
jgi:predicted Ser/Thr protein kinase